MDHAAEQSMEIEALQAILMDEFQDLEGPRPEGWPADVPCYRILINATSDSDAPDPDKQVDLVFAHTPRYPDEAPLYKPRSVRGFSQAELDQLRAVLDQQVQTNLGMACIYALVAAAQDWLRERVGDDGQSLAAAYVDPEAEKKRAQEEEEKRLAELRSHGTAVTPATFAEWKARFDAEMALARIRAFGDADQRDKGPTGKQYFLSMDARNEEEEEDYEKLFGDMEAEAGEVADGRQTIAEEDEEDIDLDEEDDDDEDFLDEYLASKGVTA